MKRGKGVIAAALTLIFCASVSGMVWADWVIDRIDRVSPVFERIEGVRLAETVVGIDGGEEIVFGEESFARAFAGALHFEDGAGRQLSFEDGDFTVNWEGAALTEDGKPVAAGPLDGSVYILAGAQVSFADEMAYAAEKFPDTVTVEYRTALIGGKYYTVKHALEMGGEIELVRASKFASKEGRVERPVLRAGSSLSGGALLLRAGETFTVESGANFASEGVAGGENAQIIIGSEATVSAVGADGTHFSAGKTYISKNGVWTISELYTVRYDAGGGAFEGDVPEERAYAEGEEIALTELVPVRENYVFLGWAAVAENILEGPVPVSDVLPAEGSVITLYAIWGELFDENGVEIERVKVTFLVGEKVYCVKYYRKGFLVEEEELPVPPSPPEGYRFGGWITEANRPFNSTSAPNEDCKVHAKWDRCEEGS